ncbi:MAG: D-alanyl-D-alanine carboxypeptidase/D-alanyl-D-alanine-endopeptidase [Cypionkella sp.]|nr:D-alanyl-D-alanine carboxypeptidase/D-alanyl-D-alanine-endopeptidase [Cypionkella sp.]
MLSRRLFLSSALAGLAVPSLVQAEAPARSPRPMARRAMPVAGGAAVSAGPERLIEAAQLGAPVTFVVMDARTGAVLEARSPDAAMPPASVAKAVTALYALERLGPDYRFRTRVLVTGPVRGGAVQGDVVLAGGGDPNLQTDEMAELVAGMAAQGIRGVTGRFLVWDGALPEVGRIAGDQPAQAGYNPALGGLNLNFNRVHFEWRRQGNGWGTSMDARGARFVPEVGMARVRVVNRRGPVYTHEARNGAEEWTVASAALGKGGSRWLPVRLPTAYAADVFRTLARAQGIALPEPRRVNALPQGQEIAGRNSEPLRPMLRDMLRFSTNITAECVGLRASGAGGLRASAGEMSAWARSRFGVRLDHVDHSGLGVDSRVSAAAMAGFLQAARGSGLREILRDVGMRDDRGEVIKGHPVKVMAKSGTLNFVSGLAGHILPPGGREMVFAIFTADLDRRGRLREDERDEPPGGAAWNRRARRLQGQLISRWAQAFA